LRGLTHIESSLGLAQTINDSRERVCRFLGEFLADLSEIGGQEKILQLRYKEQDLAVFPAFIQEFLTDHIENQGELLGYLKRDGEDLSFGLRDRGSKTDFSLSVCANSIIYHPVGFWGSWTKARRRWQWRNSQVLSQVSRFIQKDYPRALSEGEVSIMLTTAKFIADHIERSSN